ncbi:MAG: hypothetical protein KKE50_04210 [Nanoarchaeota archaeon]|nr:hypothetical protein [Nanoarchaeota archaeon]
MRIKFPKGKQREFLRRVIERTNSPSLRALKQFGIETGYQTLKSYYHETRTLPEFLFLDLCRLAGIDKNRLKVRMIDENWGQVKGGKR